MTSGLRRSSLTLDFSPYVALLAVIRLISVHVRRQMQSGLVTSVDLALGHIAGTQLGEWWGRAELSKRLL